MPMYDYECTIHGLIEDVMVPSSDRDNVCCSICDELMHRVPTAAKIVGPTFSKPLNIPNLGKSFDSKKEAETYLNEKKITLSDPKGGDFQKMYDRVRNKIEANVKKQGHKDVESFRATVRKTKEAKKQVAV